MLQNAYFLAKIGADTAENEQHFAEILPTDALWRLRPCPLAVAKGPRPRSPKITAWRGAITLEETIQLIPFWIWDAQCSEISLQFFEKFHKKYIKKRPFAKFAKTTKLAELWKLHDIALQRLCGARNAVKMLRQLLNIVLIQPNTRCLKLTFRRFWSFWSTHDEWS